MKMCNDFFELKLKCFCHACPTAAFRREFHWFPRIRICCTIR